MKHFILLLGLFSPQLAHAEDTRITKVVTVVFENHPYKKVADLPFFKKLATEGTSWTKMYAKAKPSQPNYFAMTAGDTFGVKTNGNVNLDKTHIGDLLEAKGKTWKAYADNYPGNCYTRSSASGSYVRKHTPFISYKNIQSNPKRCANIVPSTEFYKDAVEGKLPAYSFYTPNDRNNGHDTGIAFAEKWYAKNFGPLLENPKFTEGLLLITTFDEGSGGDERIYTTFWGPHVKKGFVVADKLDHYSLLRTVEDILGLGTLGRKDQTAKAVTEMLTPL